jgi:hypothetical protein
LLASFEIAPDAMKWKGAILTDTSTSERPIQIEHITIRSNKAFEEVKTNLERLVLKLDETTAQLIASGGSEQLEQNLEKGPELAIFLSRNTRSVIRSPRRK